MRIFDTDYNNLAESPENKLKDMELPVKQDGYDTDNHLHPFGIPNPRNHCFMNAVLQALFSVLRAGLHNCQFASSTEGVIAETLCSAAKAASASGEVGKLKSLLSQYSSFYNGFTQEDASECLFMLLDIIHQGTIGASLVEMTLQIYYVEYLYLILYFHLSWKIFYL